MITPTRRPPSRRPLPLSRVALVLAATLPFAACGSSDEATPVQTAVEQTGSTTTSTSTTPSTTVAARSIPAPSPTTTGEVPAVDSTDAPVRDARDRLATALAQLGRAYAFETHTSLDGVEVSVAIGRRVGNASEIAFDQQGTSVRYRTVEEQRWLQLPDGQWKSLAAGSAPNDPRRQLSQPEQLDITGSDGSTVTMTAVYDADTFSITTASELTVTLTLTDDTLTGVEYEVEQSGRLAQIRSVFLPTDESDPILAP